MTQDEQNKATIEFLSGIFGPSTEQPIFLCSLPNERDASDQVGERRIMSRDPADVASFVTRWDRPGRGLFFCVATLVENALPERPKGSVRHKRSVAEIALFHADIDEKSIAIPLDDVFKVLRELPCPPSVVVRSGHGLHCYWLLKESIQADDLSIERAERINALLADVVGGDPVSDVCRLMRLPGSHNTKRGEWTAVEVASGGYERRYEVDDVEDMLDVLSPRIARRDAPRRAAPTRHDNPFLAVAAKLGFKPSIEVKQRLAAMTYQGVDETSVHETQVVVTAALLGQGKPIEEIVDIVIEATRIAAGDYGSRWNWARERRTIHGQCESWLRKHPELKIHLTQQRAVDEPAEAVAVAQNGGGGSVVALSDHRKSGKGGKSAESKRKADGVPVIIAEGVIKSIRDGGHDVLLSEGDVWIYGAGVWTVMTPGDEQWIRTLIQQGCDVLGHSGDTKAANAAWKRLIEHPDLFRRKVEWDQGDMIALAGRMLNLRTRETSPHDSSHHCRKKVGFDYDPSTNCQKWQSFLAKCFADRPEIAGVMSGLIQEWFGSAMATGVLAREQRKALFLFGGTRTGKTQIATMARRMIGEPVAAPSIKDVGETFGRQMLYSARAWIRDDAINEGDGLDPAIFKTIVTGEPVEVKIKNHAGATHSFDIPILLTTNAMPRARDASDAIYNRSLVIDMRNEISEAEAEVERRRLGFDDEVSLGEALASEEGAGILVWALDGLDRLRARGRFEIPENVRTAVMRFKESNNPTSEFVRVALEASPHSKVERSDLLCAYHTWSREEFGDEAKATGYRILKTRLEGLPWNLDFEVKTGGTRFVGGLRLSDEGLTLWDMGRGGDTLRNGSKGSSMTKNDVNKGWNHKVECFDRRVEEDRETQF